MHPFKFNGINFGCFKYTVKNVSGNNSNNEVVALCFVNFKDVKTRALVALALPGGFDKVESSKIKQLDMKKQYDLNSKEFKDISDNLELTTNEKLQEIESMMDLSIAPDGKKYVDFCYKPVSLLPLNSNVNGVQLFSRLCYCRDVHMYYSNQRANERKKVIDDLIAKYSQLYNNVPNKDKLTIYSDVKCEGDANIHNDFKDSRFY